MKIVRWAPGISEAEEAVRKFCARSLKSPCSAELIYLPFVFLKYSVETADFFGGKKSAEGLFLVDMIRGVPINIRRGTGLAVSPELGDDFSSFDPSLAGASPGRRGERPLRLESHAAAESQVLPPLLSREEAIARGKRLLRYDLMRLAGGLRYRKFEILVHPETRTVHYPYWLVYYRGRRGEMKFSVLDSVSGKKEGDEIVSAIEAGLVNKKGVSSN